MKRPTLVVLAAGMGSRYGGLKQLDPVSDNGQIILDYSIYDAIRAGFDHVIFVIRRDIESAFREHIGGRWEKKIRVDYAFQELDALPAPFRVPEGRSKPWGTGHAVLAAKKFIDSPFAVINADDFYGASGYQVLAQALTSGKNGIVPQHYMVGFIMRNTLSEFGTVSRGLCTVENGVLKGIHECTGISPDGTGAQYTEDGVTYKLSGNETVSMNMWGFSPELPFELESLFADFLSKHGTELKSEFYLPAAVFELIKNGKVRVDVLKSSDSWFGVTYREDRANVHASIRRLTESGKYPVELI